MWICGFQRWSDVRRRFVKVPSNKLRLSEKHSKYVFCSNPPLHFPDVDLDTSKNSGGIKSILSFAVPGGKGNRMDYLTKRKESFLSYLTSGTTDQPTPDGN
eukprot:sb/3478481/